MTDKAVMRRKRGWMNLRVDEIIHETHDTDTFVLVDADEGGRQFDYVPGQYLTFRFDDIEKKPVVRSYTMSSSPCQKDFAAFTVKRVEKGLISNWLCDEVKVGTILRARGPIGRFCYEPEKDRDHLVMVAGGSGVTPFVSILREFAPRIGEPGVPKKMTLLVSFRSKQDLICWKELEEAAPYQGVRIVTTLTRVDATSDGFWTGRINDGMLEDLISGAYGETTYMTCGPEAIMNLTVAHLKDRGVDPVNIKTESFES